VTAHTNCMRIHSGYTSSVPSRESLLVVWSRYVSHSYRGEELTGPGEAPLADGQPYGTAVSLALAEYAASERATLQPADISQSQTDISQSETDISQYRAAVTSSDLSPGSAAVEAARKAGVRTVSRRVPLIPLQYCTVCLPLNYSGNPGVNVHLTGVCANWTRPGQAARVVAVSRRFPLTPLQTCLHIPGLQWQPPGLQGCKLTRNACDNQALSANSVVRDLPESRNTAPAGVGYSGRLTTGGGRQMSV